MERPPDFSGILRTLAWAAVGLLCILLTAHLIVDWLTN